MPVYKESIEITNGNKTVKLYVFSYSNDTKEKQGMKQLLSVDSCITLGTKNFTALNEEEYKKVLNKEQVYSGYYVKTINGPYDYCYKMWTDRRLPFAPLNAKIPQEDDPQDAMIIDYNKGYVGIACGPHLAYCTSEAIESLGYSIDSLKLPFVGLKVKLRKKNENRPPEIPYAAFEAFPVAETVDSSETVIP